MLSAPVDWLPEVAMAPVHAPEAEQLVVFFEDHEITDDPPIVTDVGFATTVTVTLNPGVRGVSFCVTGSPPLQEANARATTGTINKAFARNMGPRYLSGIATLNSTTPTT